MSFIGNTPGVSSQRIVLEQTISGSAQSAFVPSSGYTLGYVDVLVNGVELDSADFSAPDGVTVTLNNAAQIGDTVKIKTWLPRGLSDGYLKSESDARFLKVDGSNYITGSLGIGTSSPSGKLEVVGSLGSVKVQASGIQLDFTRAGANYIRTPDAAGYLIFATGGTADKMTLDNVGNLGLGVTPYAWTTASGYKSLDLAYAAFFGYNGGAGLAENATNTSTGWKYRDSLAATYYQQNSGQHQWFNAPSGSAGGAISFTQTMTLDASGWLGIGITSPTAPLTVKAESSSAKAINIVARSDNYADLNIYDSTGATLQTRLESSSTLTYLQSNADLAFRTNGAERVRIDSSGNVGIGCTPSNWTSVAGKSLQIYAPGNSIWSNGAGSVATTTNAQFNGGWFFQNNGYATRYDSGDSVGNHIWYNTVSGTAGAALSWVERARIDSSGNLLLGTTSAAGRVTVQYSSNSTAFYALNQSAPSAQGIIQAATTAVASPTDYLIVGQTGNGSTITTNNFIVRTNGNVTNTNNSYGSVSDAKLKENVVDATPKLAGLMQVRVVNYNLIGQEQKQLGVIAQELEQVFPAMVDEAPDHDIEGNDLGTTTKSVKYSVFVPILIKAIQEQQALIEELRADVAALKGQA